MLSTPDTRNWISIVIGSLIAVGYSAADAFMFHRFQPEVDLLILVGGLYALGIHVAFTTNQGAK